MQKQHWPSRLSRSSPMPMSTTVAITSKHRPWKQCTVCSTSDTFKNPADFSKHLRECHCIREGGSFVCTYGYNDVCSSLPVEGVSDQDYEDHVARHHIFQPGTHPAGKTASKSGYLSPSLFIGEHSIVVAEQPEWTIYSSTQNLPAVLNDPRRGKEKDFFTKTWGDTFVDKSVIPPSLYLPEITRGHFEAYLKKTKKCKKSYRKSRGSRSSVDSDNLQKLSNSHSFDWRQADLENIPKIFLQPNFSLDSPETFNTVFPFVHLGGQAGCSALLNATPNSSVHLIQEKLSHHLDTVEVQIAKHVSLRSNAFFHAMTSHDALMEQLTATIQQVKKLRDRVHHIDDILVKGSLHILKLKCRREKYVTVQKKLKLMATVHQTQPTIQLLLSTSDFVGVLDLIATTQVVLEKDLGDINSFRYLGSQLAEMEKVIEKMIEADFARYTSADLNRPLTDSDLVMEEERLVSIVMGMLRLKKHSFVNWYRGRVCDAIKILVHEAVIEAVSKSSNADTDSSITRLNNQVRLLDFYDWMALVTAVLQILLLFLTRIKGIYGVMSDSIDIAAGKAHCPASPTFKGLQTPEVTNMQVTIESDEVTVSEEDHKKLSNDLTDMLTNTCDYADDRSAKLFQKKSKDGFFEKLTVGQFIIMSKSVDSFVTSCEAICGKRSTNLQLALQSQAHRFVTQFHDEKKTKLGRILDSERWKQSEVPVQFQNLVDHISSSDSLSIPKHFCNDIKGESDEFLFVKGEKYAVISTILLLLNMLVEYCDCVNGIPYMASDLLTRLVELLKTFNSRTCQLIIGAGALQLVGLKTITTKHLALASRCLQLMVFFIPKFKSHFDKHLSQRQQNVSKQFDQALKDYNDHIQEISNKLVSIMESMIEAQLSKWEVKPPVPSACFREICKQFKKFHEMIADTLPTEQVQKLFFRINTAFKGCLKNRLQKLNVLNDGGPQHGLVTSELAFYVQSLESIKCIRNVEDLGMNDIWVAR